MRPGAMKTGGEIEMGARLDRSFGVEILFRAGGFCAPAGQDRTARAWVLFPLKKTGNCLIGALAHEDSVKKMRIIHIQIA